MPSDRLTLRSERTGADWRSLEAYLDDEGRLHIDGQDLGPSTPDGEEYEWFTTYSPAEVPLVVAALGGTPDEAVADVLSRFTGERSYELERRLRDADIPHEFFSC